MKLQTLNWNEQYKKDIESGVGFDIDNVNGISKDGVRHPNGIYSPFYGSTSGDSADYSERYSCDCKNLSGKFYNGELCPICETQVHYKKSDVKKTGWMSLNENYCLIQPNFYKMIKKIVGRQLDDIIKFDVVIDENGKIKETEENAKNPFYNIGILEFRNRFDEILDYYTKLNAAKKDVPNLYKFIMENKDKVFINKIPVFSLILRDITIIKDNVISEPINKKYNVLLGLLISVNKNKNKIDTKEIRVLPILHQSQMTLMEIDDAILNLIAGKEGHIRSNMLGNRINFSARAVIVPLVGNYPLDGVVLPYLNMMYFYKFEIINMICKMDKCSMGQALEKWNKGAEKYDHRMYLIMKHLMDNTEGGLRILINRNPSLNLGSILLMRVVDIKKDYDDLTMSIPLNILGVLAGDFDGDVLNIICLKDKALVDAFEIFNPKMMMIDRNNNRFNTRMGLIKDQVIGLHTFND